MKSARAGTVTVIASAIDTAILGGPVPILTTVRAPPVPSTDRRVECLERSFWGKAGRTAGLEEVVRIELSLETGTRDPWTVLTVHGEIDAYTSPQLRTRLRDLIDQGSLALLIDLEGVGFMDSTGLGVLVGALKHVREREGRIALVVTRPPLLRILRITGLDQVFPLFDSLDGAVAS
jgi:anti-sigma B factor antagonist